jgi:hypothetical protein
VMRMQGWLSRSWRLLHALIVWVEGIMYAPFGR